MKTDPMRAEPWYTKNNMLFRRVRLLTGTGCWCCGYEVEVIRNVFGKTVKWCTLCKFAACSVCGPGDFPPPTVKDRWKELLTPDNKLV